MSTKSYTLLKISWNLFDKHFTKLTEIEAIERDWAMRYNSEIPKWQQEMYT